MTLRSRLHLHIEQAAILTQPSTRAAQTSNILIKTAYSKLPRLYLSEAASYLLSVHFHRGSIAIVSFVIVAGVSPGARHGYGMKNDGWPFDSHLIHSCTL